ncbi:NAD(P)-binding domain containing protein [Trema orientale]|uniref:Flavanone 4-reductase n=1 Tax=Trema orientale TaxID=63057 RepID=A0A2P5F6L0_TREOI|nr:NAD(P)-binding domain containing protein [Trema orientale]
MSDWQNEVIKPTIAGMLDIMKACVDAKTVKKLVFTSSAGTVNVEPEQKSVYDESNWSDIDFCRTVKMTGWMYFTSKTLAEQAAWEFARKHNLDFITIIPTLVIGPFLMPSMPPSLITGLSLITGNESHYFIIRQGQFVHLDDLCNAHIFLYEHPKAEGRYIASSHDATIYELANLLKEKYPEYNIPTKFKDFDENIPNVHFSSKKLTDLGFQYKYSLEDMFTGAVDTCRTKGLIPLTHETKPEKKPENEPEKKPNGS